MRVILKPAGILIILVAFGLLSAVVAYDRASAKQTPASDIYAEQIRQALARQIRGNAYAHPALHTTPLLLENAGFEDRFDAVGKLAPGRGTATTHRGGEVAFPWRDDSDWADVSVFYARETSSVHSGSACQRIMVQAVRQGAVQMVQDVDLKKGETYRASCWMKSDRPLQVELGLRLKDSPYTYYAIQKATVGTEWTQISVDALVPRHEPALFVLRLDGPSNLLLDDANLVVASSSE